MNTELTKTVITLWTHDRRADGQTSFDPEKTTRPLLLRLTEAEPSTPDATLILSDFWKTQHSEQRPPDGCLPVLASTPDCKHADAYHSPRLVHGDTLTSVHMAAASDLSNHVADAFLLHAPVGTVLNQGVHCGIRTADCLTWIGVWQTPQVVLLSAAHLGWRSCVAGLHFHILDAVRRHCPTEASYRKTLEMGSCHYLSPAVFGASYPCRMEDVGAGFMELAQVRTRRNAALAIPESSYAVALFGPSQQPQPASDGERCSPDLQLLVWLDLIREGIPSQRALLHRVNTATSTVYPSHRWRHRRADPNTPVRLLSHVSIPAHQALDWFPHVHK
jgi:copper oxidase (laccase) domain-containing protein